MNQLICGDLLNVLPTIQENINLVFTSPPYAQQRDQYQGIPEAEYPNFTLNWMNRVPLAPDGSIIVNIREHEKFGQQSDYVLRTILHLIDNGWKWNGKMIWNKTSSPPFGNPKRLRRAFEDLYWFSKIEYPYINAKAFGKIGTAGFDSRYAVEKGISQTFKKREKNQEIRSTDVFTISNYTCIQKNPHPAQFPLELPNQIIQIFSKPGDLVCDPFVGSGTTAVAAKKLGRNYLGIDLKKDYIDFAMERLKLI